MIRIECRSFCIRISLDIRVYLHILPFIILFFMNLYTRCQAKCILTNEITNKTKISSTFVVSDEA